MRQSGAITGLEEGGYWPSKFVTVQKSGQCAFDKAPLRLPLEKGQSNDVLILTFVYFSNETDIFKSRLYQLICKLLFC